jgi:hypothetical protein
MVLQYENNKRSVASKKLRWYGEATIGLSEEGERERKERKKQA